MFCWAQWVIYSHTVWVRPQMFFSPYTANGLLHFKGGWGSVFHCFDVYSI